MEKTMAIWMNGKFVPWDQAKVHILTHALHYSGAVFEGVRCYKTQKGSAIFRLEDHIDRLFSSAHIMDVETHWTKQQIIDACIATVRENMMEECYIRPILYYGEGEMGINTLGKQADLAVMIWKWEAYLGKGREEGAKVMTSSWRKAPPDAMPHNAKTTGNYTLSILAKREAKKRLYDEAILLDSEGHIAEGSGENVFIVKKKVLYTPPTTYALAGITRDTVLRLAEREKYQYHIAPISRDQCYSADEMFFTGTAAEVTPIIAYDDRTIGTGQVGLVTKAMQQAFFTVVRGEEKPFPWLTHVY